jgi:hypothetical protein
MHNLDERDLTSFVYNKRLVVVVVGSPGLTEQELQDEYQNHRDRAAVGCAAARDAAL